MLRDLRLREFRGSERASGYDKELLTLYQTEFFALEDDQAAADKASKGKQKKRQRKQKCPWAVTALRNSAHHHIKALDKQMQVILGAGLSHFTGNDDHAKIA